MKNGSYNIKNGAASTTDKTNPSLVSCIKIIISHEDGDGIHYDELIKLKNDTSITNDQILSTIGSIRGVKNLVKDRIKLFLSGEVNKVDESSTTSCETLYNRLNPIKSQPPADVSSKVVIYVTSLGLIRRTKSDCIFVRNVFRNLMIKTEECDITVRKYKEEYDKLFHGLTPPQVIIDSKIIGGANKIHEMIENGLLKELTRNFEKVSYNSNPCVNCAGHGYTNCPKCLGSGHSRVIRIGATRELNYLKCTDCNDGLLRCMDCIDSIN